MFKRRWNVYVLILLLKGVVFVLCYFVMYNNKIEYGWYFVIKFIIVFVDCVLGDVIKRK